MESSGRARFPWVRLAVRIFVGAALLLVLLVPLLAVEGEPSSDATRYGYVVLAVVLVSIGVSIYRLLRRSGVDKRPASILGLAAAPVTYLACALLFWLIIRVA